MAASDFFLTKSQGISKHRKPAIKQDRPHNNIPTNTFLHKINNRNIRKRIEISSKLTIKTPEVRH